MGSAAFRALLFAVMLPSGMVGAQLRMVLRSLLIPCMSCIGCDDVVYTAYIRLSDDGV
jgi:hypothetical protein